MNSDHRCFLCGRDGRLDPLDGHHLFGGAYRSKSEKYGLTVFLCHSRCHIFGKEAAHNNGTVMRSLRRYGQKKAMREQHWTEDQFRHEFGKSYLTEEDLLELAGKDSEDMLNRVTLQGRLTADPELRTTQSGTSVLSFRIACDRNRKSQDPNAQTADFINILAWRHTAEFIGRYFVKGQMIIIDGRLQSRDYENQNGQRVYVTEVVAENVNFAGSKKENSGGQNGYGQSNYDHSGSYSGSSYLPNVSAGEFQELDDDDGELPF